MTLTRENIALTLRLIQEDKKESLLVSALLAAWDERDAVQKEFDAVAATLTEMVAGEQRRAEAAEAKLAERDAENARLREALASVANYMPDENDNPLIVIVRMAGLARAAIGGVE